MGELARKGEGRTLGKATQERMEKPAGEKREEQGRGRATGTRPCVSKPGRLNCLMGLQPRVSWSPVRH